MTGPSPTELERAEALAERTFHADAPRRRMLVIVNPYATTVSARLKNLVVYALQSRYEVEAVDTQAKLHATELCREAADEGYEVVVAFGGDGTVNEAANGLIGTDVPLTCLPGGSTNVFCRTLGIPRDVVDATEHLLQVADRFEPRLVDLGRVNGRHFTFSSGVGLDASVVERVDAHPRLKSRYTRWYYTYVAVSTFMRKYLVNPPRVRLEIEGRTCEGVTVVVQNSDPFTYFGARPIRIGEGAALDSGTLSLAVLERASVRDMPTLIPRLFSARPRTVQRHRQITGFSGVDYARVVSTDGPFPLQVDGDYIGEFDEASYGVVPRALTVVS
ncbi:MAG: diacylglycerol/lipid kinase family protein [Thermoleophilaceae bacterium]